MTPTDTDALVSNLRNYLQSPGDLDPWGSLYINDAIRAIERLTRERDEAVADAARYRWLRDVAGSYDWVRIGHRTAEESDAEIDAAIRTTKATT
jgi:hypothetical protein